MLELVAFLEIWSIAITLLFYCYQVKTIVPKGATRLALILPVVCIFLYLPLRCRSVHFVVIAAFFLSWLANFKLLLLAFDKGPLFSQPLPTFIALSCFPIELNDTQKPKSLSGSRTIFVKLLMLIVVLLAYRLTDSLHPRLAFVVYTAHIYLFLETVLAIGAGLTQAILGLDLKPQFNEPYLSTSLRDFWGRRWNLAVTGILRQAIYFPTLELVTGVLGRRIAQLIAVMATFGVSGLMHEMVLFYLGITNPSFNVSVLFLIHGIWVVTEIELKKRIGGKWRLHGVVSGFLAQGFVLMGNKWLFMPELVKAGIDKKAFEDYAAIRDWLLVKFIFSKPS